MGLDIINIWLAALICSDSLQKSPPSPKHCTIMLLFHRDSAHLILGGCISMKNLTFSIELVLVNALSHWPTRIKFSSFFTGKYSHLWCMSLSPSSFCPFSVTYYWFSCWKEGPLHEPGPISYFLHKSSFFLLKGRSFCCHCLGGQVLDFQDVPRDNLVVTNLIEI